MDDKALHDNANKILRDMSARPHSDNSSIHFDAVKEVANKKRNEHYSQNKNEQ